MSELTVRDDSRDSLERSGIDDRPIAFGFLLGYLDLAIRGVQEYPTFEEVVLGPWSELERPRGTLGLRQWIRPVEERRMMAPTLELGTLRVRMDFRERPRRSRRRPPVDADDHARRRVELRVGTPHITLFVEGRDERTADRLLALAREVAERFRRQLD